MVFTEPGGSRKVTLSTDGSLVSRIHIYFWGSGMSALASHDVSSSVAAGLMLRCVSVPYSAISPVAARASR